MKYKEILEACWKGYHKEGMKTMFGKRYPNCVKNKKKSNEGVAEGSGGAKYKIKSIGKDKNGDYYISPNTGKKVYKQAKVGDHETPSGEHKPKIRMPYKEGVAEGKRIARKPGQPANSKKHSDLYTDENPRGTITGLKFATAADARASVTKIRNSGRSHAHKIQAAVAMEQRAKAAGKTEAAAVYRRYINSVKKTDENVTEGYGRYYCSTDKKWKTRKGPKQTRQSESVDQYEYDLSQLTESELEEDLKKWFREKWVRFGPDGKIRGSCGGRTSGEGKPKCLPASKAHSLGKKGRASSAAKKRREDPNPERRGPARNVATKTRGMKEQGIPELQPSPEQQQEPNAIQKGLGFLGKVLTVNRLLRNPEQEIKNYIDPNKQNHSIIRRMQQDQDQR